LSIRNVPTIAIRESGNGTRIDIVMLIPKDIPIQII